LARAKSPFHLFGKPSLGAWNTRRKPSVVLEAMDTYPGKTVVLMDVDCAVRGDIAPVTGIRGDVGIVVIARNVRRKGRWAHWLNVECSSRVVVFRPTDGARTFARTWADTIERGLLREQAERADSCHHGHRHPVHFGPSCCSQSSLGGTCPRLDRPQHLPSNHKGSAALFLDTRERLISRIIRTHSEAET
jgi:hypothetical protein